MNEMNDDTRFARFMNEMSNDARFVRFTNEVSSTVFTFTSRRPLYWVGFPPEANNVREFSKRDKCLSFLVYILLIHKSDSEMLIFLNEY